MIQPEERLLLAKPSFLTRMLAQLDLSRMMILVLVRRINGTLKGSKDE